MNLEMHEKLIKENLLFDNLEEAISSCEDSGNIYERNFYNPKTGELFERLSIVKFSISGSSSAENGSMSGWGHPVYEVLLYQLQGRADPGCGVIAFQSGSREEPLSESDIIKRLADDAFGLRLRSISTKSFLVN